MQFSNLVQNQSGAQRVELHPINPTFAAVATVWAATYQGVAEMQQWADFICAAVNACRAINPDNPLAAANAMEQAVAALQAWDAADAVHVNCRDCMDEHEPICDRCWNLLNEAAKKRLSALTALKGGEQ